MRIDDIVKQYSEQIIDIITGRDGSGRGYLCPFCGSGSGPHGTGLSESHDKNGKLQKGKFHCFNCEWTGDGLDMIGKLYGIDNVIDQVKRAEELLHISLLDSSENNRIRPEDWDEPQKIKTQDNELEKTVENNDKLKAEILKEMETARANLLQHGKGLAYLLNRGVSADTAIKYKLGYIDNYNREGMNTPAIMIPDSQDSYTARSTTTNAGDRKCRKRKAGERQGYFNSEILDKPPAVVYIVEGQFDALSIIEVGSQAIATGGQGKHLIEEIQKHERKPIFILLPDNDRLPDGRPDYKKGYGKGKQLKEMLDAANIPALFINTADPEQWPADIKDANEYLVKNKQAFTELIRSHAQEVEDKLLGRTSAYLQDFIDQAAGATPPVTTGFSNLDIALEGGLHSGLIIIGAISSLGKTTFALNVAEQIAAAGNDVLFFSLEMSRFELISKIVSRKTAAYCLDKGLSLSHAKTNLGISDFTRYSHYRPEEMNIIKRCFNDFKEAAAKNLYIREGMGNIGAAEIKKYIEHHVNITGRTPIVVTDYLQIIAPADVRSTDKQNTDKNTVELKRLSRDFNTPVIAISSFNRDNYREPVNMAAFKESGAVEYTSDVLIGLQYMGMDYYEGEKAAAREERIRALYKENKQKSKKGQPVQIQLKILKNRSGGLADMGFYYYPMFNHYVAAN